MSNRSLNAASWEAALVEPVRNWDEDPEVDAAYERMYPFAAAGDAITALRADAGWTQRELAEHVGTTQSVIARAESGTHSFQIALLNRIAEATGTTWRPVFVPRQGNDVLTTANVVGLRTLRFPLRDVIFDSDGADGAISAVSESR